MNPPPSYLIREQGSRPGTSIYHDNSGYYFKVERESLTAFAIYFRCVHQTCYGRAVLRLGASLEHTQHHNHLANPLRHVVAFHRTRIIESARTLNYVSFIDIVEEERRRIPDSQVRLQLSYRRLRTAMQRARADVFPRIPRCLLELAAILEDPAWQALCALDGFQGSVYSGTVRAADGSNHIVFMSERCIEVLRQVQIIFADGTFKITPAMIGVYQVIPLVWVLMENKAECSYTAVLLHVRARLLQWCFTIVVCDYEDAIINSFEVVFGVLAQGCYFHFVQAICGWARSNVSQVVLQMYPVLKNIVHLCCALPLLPQYLLQHGLDAIWRMASNFDFFLYACIYPFLMYLQRDWVNHVNRGRTLSVFGSSHRTNNASESNNRRMRVRMSVDHPNVFRFIRHIVHFESAAMDDVYSLSHGIIPSRHRSPSSVSNDARVAHYSNILVNINNPAEEDLLQFLFHASFCVEDAADEAMGF